MNMFISMNLPEELIKRTGYELDYYYHSSREICEWVLDNAEQPEDSNEKIKVVSWHPVSLAHYFRKDTTRFSTGFVRWYEKGNSDWDYAVFTITGMAPEQLTNSAIFPPPNTVYTVKVDDVPIAIVLKRQDKSDLLDININKSNNGIVPWFI